MFPKGSATTLRRSSELPASTMEVAWQPSPLASVEPAQAVLALVTVEPPAIVEMVEGSAIGLEGKGIETGGFTVMLMAGVDVDVAKLPLATYVADTLSVP